ncbi:MAG: Spy/CpxP family protein refolding chaperone [Bacteroidota bacterium]
MKRISLLVAVVIALFSVYTWSQQNDTKEKPGRDKKGMEFRKHFGAELKLTDEQKKEVDKLRSETAKEMIDQHGKIAKSEIELRDLFKADTPDKSAIEKKMQAIADLKVEAKMIHINNWFAVNKLLTPDQQKVWKIFLNHRVDRKFRRFCHGHRGDRRGGEDMRGPDGHPGFHSQDAPPMGHPGEQ